MKKLPLVFLLSLAAAVAFAAKPEDQTAALKLKKTIKTVRKVKSIMIPEIDFRQAHLRDVIDTLSEMSANHDPDRMSKGINIILMLPGEEQEAPEKEGANNSSGKPTDDPFKEDSDSQKKAGENDEINDELPLVTFKARQISLYEALKIVCQLSRMQMRVEGNIVYVEPEDAEKEIVKKTYNVDPSAATRMKRMRRDMQKLKPRLRKGF